MTGAETSRNTSGEKTGEGAEGGEGGRERSGGGGGDGPRKCGTGS